MPPLLGRPAGSTCCIDKTNTTGTFNSWIVIPVRLFSPTCTAPKGASGKAWDVGWERSGAAMVACKLHKTRGIPYLEGRHHGL
eukprot:1160469-Pelagomonas_calceolata.AAC.10